MKTLAAFELNCSFLVVTREPISPFVWALLRVLNAFEPGNRPDFTDLSIRFSIGEPAFLEAAWIECINHGLVFDSENIPSFSEAEINEAGSRVVNCGYLMSEEPVERNGETLYFKLNNGEVIHWADHFTISDERFADERPRWAQKITPDMIVDAIKQQQDEENHISPDQFVEKIAVNWGQCREVEICVSRD